ncbi:penicillin-binding protein 2 [Candidatus Gottesmanbacteria bacterium]|nr:penicillin-binding protein 2 [Candidatus Gottesmanbacteria bacterium]
MQNFLGTVFSEGIASTSTRKSSRHYFDSQSWQFSHRFIILTVCVAIFFLILFFRLIFLTLLEGHKFRGLSEGNRIREVKITAPRGIIYDRNNIPLVRNIPEFITSSGEHFFETKPATASSIVRTSVTRYYPFGEVTSHVLGYTGEITKEELEAEKGNIRRLGDIVGKGGVEKSQDELLQGRSGKELIEVDALGDEIRTLGKIDPIPGKPLVLSIDSRLQKIAAETLEGKTGAVIATNPKSGEVLLLFSSPAYDPNAFISGNQLDAIFQNPKTPLFNRAISGQYPPGSTFKIITALAALTYGVVDENTKIEDTGVLKVGEFSFGNWYFNQYGKTEGMVDIVKAIRRSNDIFFYKVGEELGIEKLADFAKKMAMGSRLGIDIDGEEVGLMPDPSWVQKERGQPWYLGNTYHVAIGQGDILATPLQVNTWTNIVASSGKLCRPHTVKTDKGSCQDLGISPKVLALIREGMKQACSPGGTGWPLFKFKVQSEKLKIDGVNFLETYESTTSGKPVFEIPTACKTGTSEFGDPKGRTHAWFTVFAPVSDPEISVTVLVEAGGEGSNVAAPIAKRILEKWFGER